jgi:L-malate glycosyltransferase
LDKNLHILHLISSLNRGGRERQLATIYKYSDKNRITTNIACLNRTPTSYIDEYNMADDTIFISSKNFLKRLTEIRKIVIKNKIDVIWTWGGIEATYGILLSLITNVKHINGSVRHGIVRFNKNQLWRLLILHLSKNIVANSHAGLRANKLKRGSVLYNGVDEKFFIKPEKERLKIRSEFGIKDDVILLSSVANLVPYKDYDTVLHALSIIKTNGISFHYMAIGEGLERKRIEALAENLSLTQDVSFPGNRTDIKDLLYASDIFIHSSIGEGCSNAILEAMSAGLPVIATDTGGTGEIVDTSVGRLFAFQNVEQLVNLIMEMNSNKSLRNELALNSRKKALNEFSVESMINRYYGFLTNV